MAEIWPPESIRTHLGKVLERDAHARWWMNPIEFHGFDGKSPHDMWQIDPMRVMDLVLSYGKDEGFT